MNGLVFCEACRGCKEDCQQYQFFHVAFLRSSNLSVSDNDIEAALVSGDYQMFPENIKTKAYGIVC